MEANNSSQVATNDEINLLELFEAIWDAKWLLTGFICIALIVGIVYTQFTTPKYKTSVSYTTILHSVITQQTCDADYKCLDLKTSEQLMNLLDGPWTKTKDRKSNKLSLISLQPANTNEYIDYFQGIEKKINNAFLSEAQTELSLIQNELSAVLQGTDRVATNLLNAKRLIRSLEKGQAAIEFSKPQIIKISPKPTLIIALSIFLGGAAGIFYILLRSAIRKRSRHTC